MNEPKHTPGPWVATLRLAGTKSVRTAVCTKHDKMVCDTFRIPIEEAEANAALIASAPEMLALLKRAHEYMLNTINPATIDHETRRLEIEIRAAIFKAEGN
jgi:hypothetical protein